MHEYDRLFAFTQLYAIVSVALSESFGVHVHVYTNCLLHCSLFEQYPFADLCNGVSWSLSVFFLQLSLVEQLVPLVSFSLW